MADPENTARIRAYLKEHRATYARDDLRTRLIADGHPVETIDLAFAQEYGLEVARTSSDPVVSRTRIILIALGVCLVNYVALPLIIGLLADGTSLSSLDTFIFGSIGLVLFTLAIEIITAIVARRRDPALSRGLTWGLVISIVPLIGGILLIVFAV